MTEEEIKAQVVEFGLIMAGLTLEEQQTLYMKLGKRWKRWLGLC
ncbi:hypothetical protein LINPERHAP2_LOCUS16879 [Linum perenne]